MVFPASARRAALGGVALARESTAGLRCRPGRSKECRCRSRIAGGGAFGHRHAEDDGRREHLGFRSPDHARDDAGAGDPAVHPEVRSRFGRQDRRDGTTRDLPHVQVDPLRPLRNPSFRFWRLHEVPHVQDHRTGERGVLVPPLARSWAACQSTHVARMEYCCEPWVRSPMWVYRALRTAGRGLVAQGDEVRHLALRIGNRAITAIQGPCPTRRATRQGCGRLHPGRPHSTSGSSDARDVGRHHPGGPHARTACRGRLE